MDKLMSNLFAEQSKELVEWSLDVELSQKKLNINFFIYSLSKAKYIGKAFQRYLTDIGLKGRKYDLRTFRKNFISRS